jgi:hypothetical protein
MLMANECCSLKGAVRARIWLIAACCWAFVANVLVLCGVLGSSGVPTAIGCSVIVCVGVLWSSVPTTVTQKLRIRRRKTLITVMFKSVPHSLQVPLSVRVSQIQCAAGNSESTFVTYSPMQPWQYHELSGSTVSIASESKRVISGKISSWNGSSRPALALAGTVDSTVLSTRSSSGNELRFPVSESESPYHSSRKLVPGLDD